MIPTNLYHQKLLTTLKKADPRGPVLGLFMLHYCGSDKPGYDLRTTVHTRILKEFMAENKLSTEESVKLISSLFEGGESFNEIILGGSLVNPLLSKNFNPWLLDKWLNYTHGWAEDDVLCQSNFTADILLNNWPAWEKVLLKFAVDPNVNKRRASLVLLTKPLRLSPDPRLLKIAFDNIEKLKSEKDILITKAVSWILRSMVAYHDDVLAEYLEKNKDTLPKIAYREAYTKLTTGRKYNRAPKVIDSSKL